MQNGYAIALNEWIFDTRIRSELPLLLYISSLTAEKGYCYASNQHFAEKFGYTTVHISRQIKKLEELGYITIEYEKRGSEITKRFLRLTKMLIDDGGKCYSTINKNVKDNNTSNNNTSINIYKQKKFFEIFKETMDDDFINLIKSKYSIDSEHLKESANKFCLYWTEKNLNGKKERWEMEKTFDIKRRFYTWLSNEKKFNKTNYQKKEVKPRPIIQAISVDDFINNNY